VLVAAYIPRDMVRLKSRTQCPVGGFHFTQPETGAHFETWDFEQICQQIQAHREQNPRFKLTNNLDAIRTEVDAANALRMLSIKGADGYITNTGGGPDPNWQASRSRNWRDVAGGVRRVAAGAGTLTDWLGSGGVPVPAPQAETRAAGCAACPKNSFNKKDKDGKPAKEEWLSLFTQPVAERIKAQLQIKNDMAMKTTLDDKLEFCKACSCPLKLKVQTPLAHIVAHQTEAVKARLDKNCWILKEMTNGT